MSMNNEDISFILRKCAVFLLRKQLWEAIALLSDKIQCILLKFPARFQVMSHCFTSEQMVMASFYKEILWQFFGWVDFNLIFFFKNTTYYQSFYFSILEQHFAGHNQYLRILSFLLQNMKFPFKIFKSMSSLNGISVLIYLKPAIVRYIFFKYEYLATTYSSQKLHSSSAGNSNPLRVWGGELQTQFLENRNCFIKGNCRNENKA